MYQFIALDHTDQLECFHTLEHLELFTEYNDVKLQGILRKLYGVPLHESKDYQSAYSYIILATNEGFESFVFEIYQGSNGCVIRGTKRSDKMKQAIMEFKDLLLQTDPSDFIYHGYESDSYVKIRCGIEEGNIFYEESIMDEDEIAVMYEELGY